MSRVPYLPTQVPAYSSLWRRGFGLFGMTLLGWRVEGNLPNVPKCVLAIAPHTSNWDFIVGIFAYFALRIRASWLVKHTALKGPWGPLGRYLGGIGIDRSRTGDVAVQLAKEFTERDQLVLAITPEGTRKRVVEWKRGFHNIALAASVPIVPVAIDYSKKAIRFFEPFMPQSDFTADLARLQAHFSPEMAYDPKQYADARGTRAGDQEPGANSGADSSSR